MVHRFLRRDADGNETYWTVSGASQVQGDDDGLDPPLLDAVRIFSGEDP